MYKYKLIEFFLFSKLHCRELVELIFKLMHPDIKRNHITIKKKLKKELSYFMIEKLYLGENVNIEKNYISRCTICNSIINNSSKFKFFNYINCVDHLKNYHKFEENYNQTIFNFITNI